MKKFLSTLMAAILLAPFLPMQAQAFNMTIAPAKKVFEVNRGDTIDYTVIFRNDFDSGRYRARVVDFVYNESGVRNFIDVSDLADSQQSLTTWVKISLPEFQTTKGVDNNIPVHIEVPEDAPYGDHFGVVLIEKATGDDGLGPVTVGGSIASVLAIKVLGGKSIKSGGLVGFQVDTRERAKNTANFVIKFNNTGNEFFSVLAEVAIYESPTDEEPIKTLSRDFSVFPNVVREVSIALGDLGDNFSEKEYYAKLSVYEFHKGQKLGLMGSSEKTFQYFIPVSTDAEIHYVAKEVVVTPGVVEIVKELGLYVIGFLIVLIILIRVLFTRQPVAAPVKSSRKSAK